jgi:hypothetical protein
METEQDKKKDTYCWRVKGSEVCAGPFDSRLEAIDSALIDMDGEYDKPIMIGVCNWARPAAYLPDFNDIIERMEECAYDDEFSFWDDEIFVAKDGAEKAFNKAMMSWATEYLDGVVWCSSCEEEVNLQQIADMRREG